MIAAIVVSLAILGAAIAFAIVDLEFRQDVFYPILDNLVASGIGSGIALYVASSIGYLKNKEEQSRRTEVKVDSETSKTPQTATQSDNQPDA